MLCFLGYFDLGLDLRVIFEMRLSGGADVVET